MRYIILAVLVSLLTGPAWAGSPAIAGQWFTKGDRARVEVAACGSAWCGTIVWLREPNGSDGKPLVDGLNEDDAERGRPILGLPVLVSLTRDAAGRYVGQVYDPERGQYFDAWVTVDANTRELQVEGCALGGLVCETEVWRRAEAAN